MDSELRWEVYKSIVVEVRMGTFGGDTHILNFLNLKSLKVKKSEIESANPAPTPICFRFTQSHFNAVEILTQGKFQEYHHISDAIVTQLVNDGAIIVDASHCEIGYGYLGTDVWDGKTQAYIGHVGMRCGLPAGHGTSHTGTGPCKAHGMYDPVYHANKSMTTGRTSKVVKRSLHDKIDQYMERTFDVARELATQRMVVQELMGMAEQMDDQDYVTYGRGVLKDVLEATRTIAQTCSTASNISAKSALTSAHVLYIQVTVADLLNRWITDPKDRESALADLANRLGNQGLIANQRQPQVIDGIPSGIGELDNVG